MTKVLDCKVTAILVLYGFPRLLCGSILVHECMHAFLRLHHFPALSPKVEEGLCQLMAQVHIHYILLFIDHV